MLVVTSMPPFTSGLIYGSCMFLGEDNGFQASKLFKHFAEHGIPKAWNLVKVTPVHKRGNQADAKNYRPISVMGPLAKLYACCMN